ncbi:cation:proton antiporter [uncultured Adlercreutzia sp.]|uniref:cation:proton antiporter n=1 Tax=uncultured Adlercreutzia sp. TaxID=875803 RepID=UPI0026765AA4|nr:cation:proton antiporter [uncultured Adlercreutzia sp.]
MVTDLVSLAIIALIAFVCPIICKLIPNKAVPETVLLLAAGALTGPHLLNIVHVTDATALLSDLGLAFLFLLAGYEISPKNLTGSEGKRGAATWFITFAIAFLVVVAWPSFSVFSVDGMAVAIALTTTALGTLLPILQERGLMDTRIGTEILAYGTWGELLPVLAMTLLLSTRAKWETMLILLAFIAIALAAAVLPKHARRVGSWLFRFVIENANTNAQMLVRTVNLLLVGLTAISALFDLDIVLGAFAAGFIMRYLIPEGNPTLEMKHSAMAYGFFIPLFFVISGAKIDMRAVTANPGLLLMFIALLLFVRALPIFVSLSLGRDSRDMTVPERLTVAFYCTTALPIIVAVTTVAVAAGAMDQSTASVLVAAGGITVFIMPLLASVTARSVNADLGRAFREIRERPRAAAHILAEHHRQERDLHRQLKARRKAEGTGQLASFDLTQRCPGGVCPVAPEADDDGR